MIVIGVGEVLFAWPAFWECLSQWTLLLPRNSSEELDSSRPSDQKAVTHSAVTPLTHCSPFLDL